MYNNKQEGFRLLSKVWSKDETDLIYTFIDEEAGLDPLLVEYTVDADSGLYRDLEPKEFGFKMAELEILSCMSFDEVEDELIDGGYTWTSREIKKNEARRNRKGSSVRTTAPKADTGAIGDMVTDSPTGIMGVGQTTAFILGYDVVENRRRERAPGRSDSLVSISFSKALDSVSE